MYKERVKVWVNGQETELYTIGYVAKLLKRSVETLRAWERDKTVPRPLYRWRNGVRLYHPLEVDVMIAVLKKQGKYASKDQLRILMWSELTRVRKELVGEQAQSQATD